MNHLIVVTFADMFQADQALISLAKLQYEKKVHLEDAVVVVKTPNGRTQVKQTLEVTTAQGASAGGWWGLLVGLILGGPLGGVIGGAAAGALIGRLTDIGVDNKFIKEVGEELQPETSALFILSKEESEPTALIAEIKRFEGKILRTNLPPEAEAEIKAAIDKEAQVVADDDSIPNPGE